MFYSNKRMLITKWMLTNPSGSKPRLDSIYKTQVCLHLLLGNAYLVGVRNSKQILLCKPIIKHAYEWLAVADMGFTTLRWFCEERYKRIAIS